MKNDSIYFFCHARGSFRDGHFSLHFHYGISLTFPLHVSILSRCTVICDCKLSRSLVLDIYLNYEQSGAIPQHEKSIEGNASDVEWEARVRFHFFRDIQVVSGAAAISEKHDGVTWKVTFGAEWALDYSCKKVLWLDSWGVMEGDLANLEWNRTVWKSSRKNNFSL